MTTEELEKEASEYASHYSEVGLTRQIQRVEANITSKEDLRKRVLAGAEWNPLMREASAKQLLEEIDELREKRVILINAREKRKVMDAVI